MDEAFRPARFDRTPSLSTTPFDHMPLSRPKEANVSECFLCLKARHIADGYDTADESVWEQISYNLHHAKLAALERERQRPQRILYKALSHKERYGA